jgi:hypothetical protein
MYQPHSGCNLQRPVCCSHEKWLTKREQNTYSIATWCREFSSLLTEIWWLVRVCQAGSQHVMCNFTWLAQLNKLKICIMSIQSVFRSVLVSTWHADAWKFCSRLNFIGISVSMSRALLQFLKRSLFRNSTDFVSRCSYSIVSRPILCACMGVVVLCATFENYVMFRQKCLSWTVTKFSSQVFRTVGGDRSIAWKPFFFKCWDLFDIAWQGVRSFVFRCN